MTSASYPVGSLPAPNQQSFLVHLQGLTDISRELQTQVDGIAKPLDAVGELLTDPPAFGPFSEASTLTTWSDDAATQMQGLISDVRAAMQFADEVTRTVATGYAQADDDVSWGLGGHAPVGTVVGIATGTTREAVGAVGGVTAGLTHTLGGVVDGVGQTVQGVGQAVRGVTDGVTQTVGGATGSILGALTGGPRGGNGGIV
ncbi:hypothetical protein ACXR2U_13525 [Jatrophihabitans sp. YIM 134969]